MILISKICWDCGHNMISHVIKAWKSIDNHIRIKAYAQASKCAEPEGMADLKHQTWLVFRYTTHPPRVDRNTQCHTLYTLIGVVGWLCCISAIVRFQMPDVRYVYILDEPTIIYTCHYVATR
jgi:hypothetical protein